MEKTRNNLFFVEESTSLTLSGRTMLSRRTGQKLDNPQLGLGVIAQYSSIGYYIVLYLVEGVVAVSCGSDGGNSHQETLLVVVYLFGNSICCGPFHWLISD